MNEGVAAVVDDLRTRGYSIIDDVLTAAQCEQLIDLYEDEKFFRKRVVMNRDSYGYGEYKYFAYPLPQIVEELREQWFGVLRDLASEWLAHVGYEDSIGSDLAEFLALCREFGQTDPTPLMLSYPSGGSNAPHQDKYGRIAFPFQLMVMLSRPGEDFAGGEFVLHEKVNGRKIEVKLNPVQGAATIFPNQFRPILGRPGARIPVRHGVSSVMSGERRTLGVIFHDARGRR